MRGTVTYGIVANESLSAKNRRQVAVGVQVNPRGRGSSPLLPYSLLVNCSTLSASMQLRLRPAGPRYTILSDSDLDLDIQYSIFIHFILFSLCE